MAGGGVQFDNSGVTTQTSAAAFSSEEYVPAVFLGQQRQLDPCDSCILFPSAMLSRSCERPAPGAVAGLAPTPSTRLQLLCAREAKRPGGSMSAGRTPGIGPLGPYTTPHAPLSPLGAAVLRPSTLLPCAGPAQWLFRPPRPPRGSPVSLYPPPSGRWDIMTA